MLAPEEAREAGLTDYDREVLQVVADSLATTDGVSDERAAEVFSRVMDWAVTQDLGPLQAAPDLDQVHERFFSRVRRAS